jgi:hypothetical protein
MLDQGTATILAALIAAFVGSWGGAQMALRRFKKERAFEKRMAWYEQTIRALHYLAERIEIASTYQDEKDKHPPERLAEVWQEVQGAHIDMEAVINEGILYGSEEAIKNCARIVKAVQDIADVSEAFDLAKHPEVVDKLPLIDQLPAKLRRAARPLAREARQHLGVK